VAVKLIDQVFAKLLSWMVLHVRSDTADEIEILVLRHQRAVLRRRTPRPRIRSPSSVTLSWPPRSEAASQASASWASS
jgi:hypothetical protein